MTNEESAGGSGEGRSPRQGSGNSPVGSTLSIVLAVIAVVAGFLILRNITDDGGGGSATEPAVDPAAETDTGDGADAAEDEAAATASTTTEPAPTTTFEIVTEGATVVVANANGISGSAGRMSTRLENRGFTMGEPANAVEDLEDSVVQYDASIASAQDVAESVAFLMGGIEVTQLETPPPVDGGDIGGAGVLVLLGANEADKTLNRLQRDAAAEATGAAPEPSGSEDGTADTTEDTTADTTADE